MTSTQTTTRRRLMAAALFVTASAGVAGMVGPQATANAAPPAQYVAIAYSPVDKHAGLAINANLDTAVTAALARCGEEAGFCQLVAWSKDGCAALAVNGESYYGWHGGTYAEAQNGALQRAGGGRISMSQCIVR